MKAFLSKKKALLIVGARQVGKSTIAREFGKTSTNLFWKSILLSTRSTEKILQTEIPKKILFSVSARLNQENVPHSALLILDQAQECPDARTTVRFLTENGTADGLGTGSLLGVNIHQIDSLPAGYEELICMFPMNFEEFCWAVSTRQETLPGAVSCCEKETERGRRSVSGCE